MREIENIYQILGTVKLKQTGLIIVLLILIAGCAPMKDLVITEKMAALDRNCKLDWLNHADEKPKTYKKVGEVKYSDTGFTDTEQCTEELIREYITNDACTNGANTVFLINEKKPSFWGSTCYQVTAEFGLTND